MKEQPLISVILPVYNSADYIKASVESILKQTYPHFELIIINDGSTDQSEVILKSFTDSRIRFVSQANQGLSKTLNTGISLSHGELIARQDSDDISKPERFEEQVRFLNAHQEVMLLGTRATIIDGSGKPTTKAHTHPTSSAELKTDLLFNNPFVHSSVMFRKSILQKSGMYISSDQLFEDYHLWSVIAGFGEIANLPQQLLEYREVGSGISQTTSNYRLRVFHQSFQNCLPYVEKNEEQSLKNIIAIYHSCFDLITNDASLGRSSSLLAKLLLNFSRKHGYSLAEMNASKHLLSFQRSYYSYKIDSGIFSKRVAFLYKIKRKLFLNKLP